MRKRDEYQSKVTEDAGLKRGRVPMPLLRDMGARAGDHLVFRVGEAGRAVVRLERARKKSAKRSKRR
jgi:hypothetical protein